jgi:hypothetical protein
MSGSEPKRAAAVPVLSCPATVYAAVPQDAPPASSVKYPVPFALACRPSVI